MLEVKLNLPLCAVDLRSDVRYHPRALQRLTGGVRRQSARYRPIPVFVDNPASRFISPTRRGDCHRERSRYFCSGDKDRGASALPTVGTSSKSTRSICSMASSTSRIRFTVSSSEAA